MILEADEPPLGVPDYFLRILFHPFELQTLIWLGILVLLLICSAMISGSEVAFFSLSSAEVRKLRKEAKSGNHTAFELLQHPERLLGTILVSNNFVNIGIILLSTFITQSLVDFSDAPVLGFIIKVVVITFILLLFGEILPKIYATQIRFDWVKSLSRFIKFLDFLFRPIVSLLVLSTNIINKRLSKYKQNISIKELSEALDLEYTEVMEDEKILKGITRFGTLDARDIMKPRMDVFALDIKTPYRKVLQQITKEGYSRIPVYESFFDHIKGILYIKDLLPHLGKPDTFRWQSLLRPAYFVPESKKINDLLFEFQSQKIHMAVVIDEYGGNSGIVTLEDILEEIVGEIEDENDEDETLIKKIKPNQYLAEAKILLTDLFKNLEIDAEYFSEVQGEADTLAGLILEMRGTIPKQGEVVRFKRFVFRIVSADNRRIKKIHITIQDEGKEEHH